MPHRTSFPTRSSHAGHAAARRALLHCLAGAALSSAALPLALPAQPATGARAEAPPLSRAVRTQVIDSVSARLASRYIDADTARRIADVLRVRQRAGAYDSIAEAARFAEIVTRDLRAVNGDLHLSLRHDPRLAARLRAQEAREPTPRRARPDSAPPRIPPPSNGPVDPFTREAQLHNFGLAKLEILPLNVGYLEVEQFLGAEGVDQVIAAALRFLERTDAIIIDVRRNGGGSSEMSHYLFSHFLGAASVPTIRVVNRGEGDTTVQRSYEEVAGPRRPDVPLYVLTSRGTGSAAEEFTFVLKNLGRATIVGDRTAGAGHMVESFDVGNGFVVSVSITRVTDARSGNEWERVGVQPDLRVAPERARDAAYAHAMRTLAARTSDAERKTFLTRRVETIDAQLRAPRPDAARLALFAGTYEGERVVRVGDGKLWFHPRPGAMPDEMIPLGGDRFALRGATWVTFETGGAAAGAGARMLVDRADGTKATYVRTSPAAAATSAERPMAP